MRGEKLYEFIGSIFPDIDSNIGAFVLELHPRDFIPDELILSEAVLYRYNLKGDRCRFSYVLVYPSG